MHSLAHNEVKKHFLSNKIGRHRGIVDKASSVFSPGLIHPSVQSSHPDWKHNFFKRESGPGLACEKYVDGGLRGADIYHGAFTLIGSSPPTSTHMDLYGDYHVTLNLSHLLQIQQYIIYRDKRYANSRIYSMKCF